MLIDGPRARCDMVLFAGDGAEQVVEPVRVRRLVPNDRLRLARLRCTSPSGSGRALSRQELADLASRLLDAAISGDYIGRLERGEFRWPRAQIRRALRQVLHAQDDAELGFYVVRAQPTALRCPADGAGAARQALDLDMETLEVAGVRVRLGRHDHVSAVVVDDSTAQVRVQVGQVLVVIEAASGARPQPSHGEAVETGDANVISLAGRRPQ